MQHSILPNGNLLLTLEADDVEPVTDILDRLGDQDHLLLAELFEYAGWPGNGVLYPVLPVHVVGALTDAPIISDQVDYEDDGTVNVSGKVWWFPQYELRNFCRDLLEDRKVIFTASPKNSNK